MARYVTLILQKGLVQLEIPIIQDIRKFKTKDIGNFSFKEAGFIVLAVGSAFITYKIAGSLEIALIPLALILIAGFFKPFGLTFVQFLRTVVKEQFTPRTYICETDFEYDADEFDELYGEHIRVSKEWNVIQTDTTSNNKSIINKFDKSLIIR